MARFSHIAWITPAASGTHGISFSRRVGAAAPAGAVMVRVGGYGQRPGAEALLTALRGQYPAARLVESTGTMLQACFSIAFD